jgi:phosphate transport system permease protein
MTSEIVKSSSAIDFDSPKIKRYNRIRFLKDKLASVIITLGGISVISAILLIFLYLLYEVLPMFESASIEPVASYQTHSGSEKSLYLSIEEQNNVAMQVFDNGKVKFFYSINGEAVIDYQLPIPEGVTISSFAVNTEESHLLAAGLSDGSVLLFKHEYKVTYPDDKRVIEPWLDYPYGQQALMISEGRPLYSIALRDKSSALMVIGFDGSALLGIKFNKEEDFLSDEITLVPQPMTLPELNGSVGEMLIDVDQRFMYAVVNNKKIAAVNLQDSDITFIKPEAEVTDIQLLLGGISLLVADTSGNIGQWFLVRNELGEPEPRNIRNFTTSSDNGLKLATEQRRKGFASVNSSGEVELFHTTSHRYLFSEKLLKSKPVQLTLSPRASRLMVLLDDKTIQFFKVKNQYPEISWSALWTKVWYESYPEPQYVWQSSAATNDFEQKMSLMPLSFGTLKAAFYAMLLGAPLAVCGAIYTAYFMTPVMRRKIKPLVELMEALPTVILGFLAGLWLAPFMENNLAAIFLVLLLMPPAIIVFAYFISRLPVSWQNRINEGWHGFILIPVIILITMACFGLSTGVEQLMFGGDMRSWLTHEMGIPFDQRNALVVGIAMGFAVVPTIFSISEDAIFSVPKHLSYGSLALGATPWQTLVGVVLPTASPGIFSALMIGLGRAVGETMIVLMATGNTPIMDANIFEGMRTLSANIAIEIPEAEVGSTHYRVLFLAAFVLFAFTFVLNTASEMIRQNLRKKYGSL